MIYLFLNQFALCLAISESELCGCVNPVLSAKLGSHHRSLHPILQQLQQSFL